MVHISECSAVFDDGGFRCIPLWVLAHKAYSEYSEIFGLEDNVPDVHLEFV
jgi:hypothetical protein